MTEFDPYPRTDEEYLSLSKEVFEIAKQNMLPLSWYKQETLAFLNLDPDNMDFYLYTCKEFRCMSIEQLMEFRDLDSNEERMQLVRSVMNSMEENGSFKLVWNDKLKRLVED